MSWPPQARCARKASTRAVRSNSAWSLSVRCWVRPFARSTSSWWMKNSTALTMPSSGRITQPGRRSSLTRAGNPFRCRASTWMRPVSSANRFEPIPGSEAGLCSRIHRCAARSPTFQPSHLVGASGPSSDIRSHSDSRCREARLMPQAYGLGAWPRLGGRHPGRPPVQPLMHSRVRSRATTSTRSDCARITSSMSL